MLLLTWVGPKRLAPFSPASKNTSISNLQETPSDTLHFSPSLTPAPPITSKLFSNLSLQILYSYGNIWRDGETPLYDIRGRGPEPLPFSVHSSKFRIP